MSYELEKTKLSERLKPEVLSSGALSTLPCIRREYFLIEQSVFVLLYSIKLHAYEHQMIKNVPPGDSWESAKYQFSQWNSNISCSC